MDKELFHSCPELIDYINEIGFLPLLSMGIPGWSAEEVVDEDCQYNRLPDGGWEWPLWEWKGSILQESGCAYGKFFKRKAAFIGCIHKPRMVARFLQLQKKRLSLSRRRKYRRHYPGYSENRRQPHHTRTADYGWGWSLLTTPETLFGKEACHPERTPQESYERILQHFRKILPDISEQSLGLLLK